MAALGFITEPQDEVATPAEAAARARERLDGGADAVKVYAGTWFTEQPVVMPAPSSPPRRGKPTPGASWSSPTRPTPPAWRRRSRGASTCWYTPHLRWRPGATRWWGGWWERASPWCPPWSCGATRAAAHGWPSPAPSSGRAWISSGPFDAPAAPCCSAPMSATCWTTTRRRRSTWWRRRASASRTSWPRSPPIRPAGSGSRGRPAGSRPEWRRTWSCSTAIPRGTSGRWREW